jgi:hypothetical protein
VTIDTKRLREIAERATPGPWESILSGPVSRQRLVVDDDACKVVDCGVSNANAAFIAAANPQTVLALLDEIDRYAGYDKELAAVGLRTGQMVTAFEAESDSLRSQLAALAAARDEACEIATFEVTNDELDQDREKRVMRRLAELRKVGKP